MSFSDFSDLTDLSSSDEDDVPLAKRTSKAKKGPKEYKITHVLRAPRTAQYTAKSLYGTAAWPIVSFTKFSCSLTDQIIENAVDLDPEYQRGMLPLVEQIVSVTWDLKLHKRRRMAGRKAVWTDRFDIAQLLHTADYFWYVNLLLSRSDFMTSVKP